MKEFYKKVSFLLESGNFWVVKNNSSRLNLDGLAECLNFSFSYLPLDDKITIFKIKQEKTGALIIELNSRLKNHSETKTWAWSLIIRYIAKKLEEKKSTWSVTVSEINKQWVYSDKKSTYSKEYIAACYLLISDTWIQNMHRKYGPLKNEFWLEYRNALFNYGLPLHVIEQRWICYFADLNYAKKCAKQMLSPNHRESISDENDILISVGLTALSIASSVLTGP